MGWNQFNSILNVRSFERACKGGGTIGYSAFGIRHSTI
ncbi:hypothetical protein D1AOALGA4SA_2218 [Olavius algarvensis Delta 1 endosymbiont]|nr:hypothetical protein D1AOALGA4SA_2218 [Olavius algarvensis Delta 1 endosymbiont]